MSFPDQWDHIETVRNGEHPLYLAGFPLERARTHRDHFAGLGPEINVSLVFYRLYKFFQPWPMRQVTIEWDQSRSHGRVMGSQEGKLQPQPIGQAQAWFGLDYAILWECYFDLSRRTANWEEALAEVWRRVEWDIGASKIFTPPSEPSFEADYTDYLKKLGYEVDTENVRWWSKTSQQNRTAITPPD